MAGTVASGAQDFWEIVSKKNFYVGKTRFIKEWWERQDTVTLITRPRHFGKTLTISMLDYFLLEKDVFTEEERTHFKKMAGKVGRADFAVSLRNLSDYLYRYCGKKVIILLIYEPCCNEYI